MNLQQEIIKELHVKPVIEPAIEIRNRMNFLKNYCKQTSAKGFVLGISGGIDSTLAGRLSQMAVEELRAEGYEAKFISVRLPYATQKDEADAQAALDFIRPDETVVFNIEQVVNGFTDTYNGQLQEKLTDFNKGNVKARVRMMAQYALAGQYGCLVVGADHAAEAVTGFFTKFGDGGVDILPLAGLTKRQVRQLLISLHAPKQLYLKIPTADLLDEKPAQSDEVELGMSYDVIDDFLEGKPVAAAAKEAIIHRYNLTEHKRKPPVTVHDEWWT
ncbi:ammonia-dependent NAD(+) synthetase [Paenibacillus yanchengensis]|uniref:NH(3)-dependent NAD(+) synthetase n=1 Tax=Paenibacillus yanchengensis TaxID=2035833 RepID=A0ABW4YHR6_9BACL